MRRSSFKLALAVVALLCGPLPLVAQQRAAPVRGDVNGDGRITSADALAVMAYLRGRQLPANFDVVGRGDADGDGVITRADAERITRLAVGREVEAPGELPGAPGNAVRLECVASVQSRAVQCQQTGSAGAGAGTALADRIVYGGQNQYVTLTSGNIAVAGNVFSFDVTVKNLIRQPIGTTDGVTADPEGVQVLFANGVRNTTPGNNGNVSVVNHDGTGTFTASDQKFFRYVGILEKDQVSPVKNWQIQFDPGVETFRFDLYVSSPVRFPRGYVVVTPARDTLFTGETVQLIDSVRTATDNPIPGAQVTWSTSDAAVATVDASTGLVTAVGPGTATITATNSTGAATRTGTATITVLAPASAYRVAANDTTPVAGDSITVTAQLVDGGGVPVATAGRTVTWGTMNGGSFASPTSTTDATGLATVRFRTDTIAAADSVTATDGTLRGALALNPTAGDASPARSTITAAPDTIVANGSAASTITVQLADRYGNVLAGTGGTVTLSATAGTLSAVTYDGNGRHSATLTSTTVGSATVTGAIDGNAIADNATVEFVAGAAARVSITTEPSDTVASGAAFARQPVVQLRDANGNAVALAGTDVTVAIATGGGTLAGTLTATTDASGVATFTDISITGTAGGRTLAFTADGLVPDTSATVTVTAGAASLATSTITVDPDTIVGNGTSTTTATVQLRDAEGNNLTASGGTVVISSDGVTVSATTDNGDGTYTATITSAATIGGPIKVRARLDGQDITATADLWLVAGAPARYFVSISDATPLAGSAQTIYAQLVDSTGNAVATGTARTVTWTSTNGGTFSSATSQTNSQGLATITFTASNTAGTIHTVTATDAAGITGTSGTITAQTGPAAKIGLTRQPSATAPSGVVFARQPVVQVQDAVGNPVAQSGTEVTVTIASGGGTLGGTTTLTTDGNGRATFTNLSISGTVGPRTLTFTTTALGSVTSETVEVTAGPLDHFLVEQAGGGPIGNQLVGTPFNVRVTARDAANNTVTTFTGTVAFTSNPAGGITAGGTSGAFTAGVLGSHAVTFGTTGSFTLVATRTGGTESGASNSFEVQAPPTANDDAPAGNSAPGAPFHGAFNTTLNLPASGVGSLMNNDVRGFPAAEVEKFGGGSLGGTVESNNAGSTVTFGTGGSLTVNADGSVSFTPSAGFTGNFTFNYRLRNVRGFDDAQVTLAVGVRPAAVADTYSPTLVGNVPVNTATSTQFRVTTNDAGDAKQVLASGTPVGGTVTLDASGTFTFTPERGFSGPAYFDYTLANGFGTTAATRVSLTVGTPVFFVNAAATAGGDGRYTTPYNNVAPLSTANDGAGTNPAAGDAIFLYSGSYTGPLTLLASQRVIGQGATASLATIAALTWPADAGPEPATNGTAPTITSSANGVTLGAGNVLRGFNLGNATGVALSGTNFGTLTISEVGINTTGQALSLTTGTLAGSFPQLRSTGGSNNVFLSGVATTGTSVFGTSSDALSGATGNGVLITGQNGSFTFPAPVTNTSTSSLAVNVVNKTGGTVTFSGDINPAAAARGISVTSNTGGSVLFSGASQKISSGATAGVNLTNNTGATISFTGGGLAITTTTGNGFNATGGGTVIVDGAVDASTISSTGGIALNVANTTIGAGGLNFRSISANGGTNGIVLNNVGTNGFQVTGDGASDAAVTTRGRVTARSGGGTVALGSGGTIQNVTGKGIFLSNAGNVVLRNLTIQNNGSAGADSTRSGIAAAAVTGLELDNLLVSGHAGNYGLRVGGSSNLTITHSQFLNNATTSGVEATDIWNVRLDDMGGTSTVRHSLFQNSREMTLGWYQTGTSSGTVNVTNAEFSGTTAGNGVNLGAFNSATANLSVVGSRIQNNSATGLQYASNDAAGGSVTVRQDTLEQNTVDISLAHQGAGRTLDYTVSQNVTRQQFKAGSSNSINVYLGGTSTAGSLMRGTISNNVVGAAGIANSGSDLGRGIFVEAAGAGTGTAVVTNNTVRQIKQESAFYGQVAKGTATAATSPRLNLTITGNDFQVNTASANALAGIELTAGTIPNIGDNPTMCANIQSNTAFVGQPTFAGVYVVTSGFTGSGTSANPTVELQGYAGPTNDLAQLEAFLGSSARATTNTPAPILARTTGTVRAATAACPTS
jgi:adhesin/invasin